MSKFFYESVLFPGHTKWINYLLRLYKVWVIIFFSIITTRSFAQSPDPNTSCTSGDLTLVSAILPPNAGDDACGTCTLGSTITRHLILSINNKTGSTRTSFAFWGNLEVYNSAGTLLYTRAITRCKGPIPKNAITPVDFDTIQYQCGQSLKLTNLFLAWTSASPGETCPLNPATINPKCGTLPLIPVVAGLDADFVVASATCTAGGSITVSPFGGKPPYSVTIEGVTHSGIGKDGSTTFTNLTAGSHSITITDATTPTACSTTKTRTIGSSSAPTANAGTDFTKTCTSNATGGQIGGETAQAGFSYSWSSSPSGFTSTSAQPAVNPSVTTTYTLTKTNTTTGCFATDAVTVTVDNATVVADAGTDFTKTCTSNASGGQVGGEAAQAGFSYSWTSSPAGFTSSSAQPTVNPSATTTYTLTKTNTTTGCYGTDDVTVTVNNATVTANAGSDFTKTCTSNASGGQVGGEAAQAGFSYSWTSSPAGFTSSSAQPNVNPSATTTYTLTKTNTTTGCYGTDDITVTVDNATVTANAGNDFTKTCTSNSSGGQLGGEADQVGFSYSWTSSPAGFTSSSAQPNVNPSATTTYTLTKTNTTTGCYGTDDVTVTVDNATVTANAGSDFTKTCTTNASGGPIGGEAAQAGFSYSWTSSPSGFTSSSAQPTVNPSATTTYTLTKTNTTTGCYGTDDITVTVNNATVTANAGSDFTKTCSANTSGKQIGEASTAGFTYSWSPATGLSDANSSNPTANPSATTTYTVTKTNSTTGCFNTDEVTVTVNNTAPTFTVCVVQPTLCANSGSVKITASGGSGLEYSIDGGANYFSNGGIFSNLGSGSVTGIKVRNSDGCISTETLCNDLNVCPPEETAAKTTALITENSTQTSVKAYPNPFSDRIKFVVTSATGGQASLDVFNFMGQKVKTVYTGFIPAGTQTFELNMPAKQISNLVYVLRIGDQKISGKLLKLNQ